MPARLKKQFNVAIINYKSTPYPDNNDMTYIWNYSHKINYNCNSLIVHLSPW